MSRRFFLLVPLAIAVRAGAQTVTVPAAVELLDEPGGRAVVTVRAGTPLQRGAARGGFTAATLDGFVDTSAVRAARSGPFTLIVRPSGGTTLRRDASPSAAAAAQLPSGMGLTLVARRGAWVQVRRSGWVASARLGSAAPAASASAPAAATVADGKPATRGAATTAGGPPRDQSGAAAAPARSQSTAAATSTPPAGALTPVRALPLRDAPEGAESGTLSVGTVVTPLLRDRGWVKVQVEGWVREGDLVPADTALRGTLSAADLRADPEGTRGRLVHWDVEFLALRTADPLRKELKEGEPYILARGPGGENSLLYLAVPPSLLGDAGALQPLEPITVTARVRSGRSQPVGIPILDLVTLSRR